MKPERFRLLAAVIAAHPEGKVFGRTRLQKTMKLLQSLGLSTDYDYMLHFYGPYSEGLQAEIGLLHRLELVDEKEQCATGGRPYFVIEATPESHVAEIDEDYGQAIRLMAEADLIVLELAATYDSFREMGMTHEAALEAVRRKKGTKCEGGKEEKAVQLLQQLGLLAA